MRVLMLNPSFSGAGYTHCLCNALVDAGCHVELYTGPYYLKASRNFQRTAYQPQIRFYRHTQLRSYKRGPARRMWRALRLLGHLWSMARVLAEARRFDVVHVQFLSVRNVDRWWLRAIARRAALIYTVHNLYPHDVPRHGKVHRIFDDIYATCHVLFAHTDETIMGLVDRFAVPREKIIKIPHGNANYLRDQNTGPQPADVGFDPVGPPVVLFFGALRHHKGIDVLLRAAALLRRDGMGVRTVIAGVPSVDPGPYLDLARELDLDDAVEFRLGYVPDEAVPTYFRAASVVVLPYRVIDQSGVAVSAISLGRAVVATRVAGLAELVGESDAGLLVPVDDPQATADAIKRLLTDEGLRRRCEANATRYADTALAWEPIAERTIEIYRRVTSLGHGGMKNDGGPACRPS